MKYFRNTELARIYHVSEKTVRNWVESAVDGKNTIEIYAASNGKKYVANTSKNTVLIEKLVESGKKFKNTRGYKLIYPSEKFYEMYSRSQIFDIISNLAIHREIPLKYTYVDGGAKYWDKFAKRLADEETPNLITCTIQLLESNLDNLDRLAGSHRKINIVDLGPGNGIVVRELLTHLLEKGRLNRYIAVDISKDILKITEEHIQEWFGDKVPFEGYVRDIENERFDDLFVDDNFGEDANIPTNVVLLLGGTLCNFRSPNQSLQAINTSMGLHDLLFCSTKLDTPNSRRYFDFNISPETHGLTPRHRLPLDLLNIDESLYELNQFFDEQKKARFITIRPKVAISIRFALDGKTRTIDLHKNEPVLLWRYWHQDALDVVQQFDENDLELMRSARSDDGEFLLLTTRIKRGKDISG